MSTFARLLDDTGDVCPSLSQSRNQLYASFVQRAQKKTLVQATLPDIAKVLNSLLEKNLLFFNQAVDGRIDVCYSPSSVATEQLSQSIPFWPESISNRLKKSLRSSQGAICRLEIEGGNGHIEVFVTDWSSCTAACGVALHAYHPIARQSVPPEGQLNYFTGMYVRNPLTDDLMSVWVADWVKPDFGTGAVLVNPAHNSTDLKFARSVGLPIRFALAMQAPADEQSRPVPPVLKTGFAVRTGASDGKPADQMHVETINSLLRKGSAVLHNDKRLPSQAIARAELLAEAEPHSLFWNRSSGLFTDESHLSENDMDLLPVRLACMSILSAAATVVLSRPEYLQADAGVDKSSLLVLAALIYDLAGYEGFVPLELLELVEYAGKRDLDEAMKLILLVGEAPEKILVVRKTLIEQVDAFQDGIKKVQLKLTDEGAAPPDSVFNALERADPVSAFKEFCRWQKSVISSGVEIHGAKYRSVLGALGVEIGN